MSVGPEAEGTYIQGKNPLLSYFNLSDSCGHVHVVYSYRHVYRCSWTQTIIFTWTGAMTVYHGLGEGCCSPRTSGSTLAWRYFLRWG